MRRKMRARYFKHAGAIGTKVGESASLSPLISYLLAQTPRALVCSSAHPLHHTHGVFAVIDVCLERSTAASRLVWPLCVSCSGSDEKGEVNQKQRAAKIRTPCEHATSSAEQSSEDISSLNNIKDKGKFNRGQLMIMIIVVYVQSGTLDYLTFRSSFVSLKV